MSAIAPIFVGVFEGFSWIRCEGKGSFLNSPLLKSFGDERISAGERCLVADLGACTGMDSTFMGTLAGMATRLSGNNGGVLQVADPGARNQKSLEDLGLDFLLEIDPSGASWQGRIEAIRGELSPFMELAIPSRAERTRHVLTAHETLAGANERNAREFSAVLQTLRREADRHEDTIPRSPSAD